jgi:hypothetical protein
MGQTGVVDKSVGGCWKNLWIAWIEAVRDLCLKAQDVVMPLSEPWTGKCLLDNTDPFDESHKLMFLLYFYCKNRSDSDLDDIVPAD